MVEHNGLWLGWQGDGKGGNVQNHGWVILASCDAVRGEFELWHASLLTDFRDTQLSSQVMNDRTRVLNVSPDQHTAMLDVKLILCSHPSKSSKVG